MFKEMNPDRIHPQLRPFSTVLNPPWARTGLTVSPWELTWMVDIWFSMASRSCFVIMLHELEELSTRKHKSICKWSSNSPS